MINLQSNMKYFFDKIKRFIFLSDVSFDVICVLLQIFNLFFFTKKKWRKKGKFVILKIFMNHTRL